MTRINRDRSNAPLTATAAILLALAGCTPSARLVAVATERSVIIYDADLQPRDTLNLPWITDGEMAPRAILFGGDGASIVVALHGGGAGAIAQIGRFNGTLVRLIPLTGERPDRIVPFADGHRFLTIGRAPESAANDSVRGVASIVTLSVRKATRVRLGVCADHPVNAAVHSDGKRAYVVCEGDVVAELDTELDRVVRRTPFNNAMPGTEVCGAGDIALSRNETLLLIPCRRSGRLLYLDRVTLAPLDSVIIGVDGEHLVVSTRLPSALLISEQRTLVRVDLRARHADTHASLPGPVLALVPSADGRWIFGAFRNGAGGVVKLNFVTGLVAAEAVGTPGIRAIAVWPGAEAPVMSWSVDRPRRDAASDVVEANKQPAPIGAGLSVERRRHTRRAATFAR